MTETNRKTDKRNNVSVLGEYRASHKVVDDEIQNPQLKADLESGILGVLSAKEVDEPQAVPVNHIPGKIKASIASNTYDKIESTKTTSPDAPGTEEIAPDDVKPKDQTSALSPGEKGKSENTSRKRVYRHLKDDETVKGRSDSEGNRLDTQWRARASKEDVERIEEWRKSVGLSKKDANRYAFELARKSHLDQDIIKKLELD